MRYLYVPFDAPDLIESATNSAGGTPVCVHGKSKLGIAPEHEKTGILHVVAHGGFKSGSLIGGTVGGTFATLTAIQLAEALFDDGLPRGWDDLRLLVCWGGYVGGSVTSWTVAGVGTATLNRDAGEAPFAGQLCSALKGRGFYRMIVTGYRGAISFRHWVYSDGPGGASDRDRGEPLTLDFQAMSNAQNREVVVRTKDGGVEKVTRSFLTQDNASRTVWY